MKRSKTLAFKGLLAALIMAATMLATAQAGHAATKVWSNFMITAYHDVSAGVDQYCLDIMDWDTREGAGVQAYHCHGGANQRWDYYDDGTIRSQLSGLCVDLANFNPNDGAGIWMWHCHAQSNQRWRWQNSQITTDLNGKCLDLDVNTLQRVQTWSCVNNAWNQQWYVHFA